MRRIRDAACAARSPPRSGLATIAGPLVGGAVAGGFGWEWIFWLNVPLGLATMVLARLRIEESHGPDTRLDVPGLLLVTGAGLGLVWRLVRGNGAGWRSPGIVAALVAGTLLALCFLVWERRAREPMLPPRLFRSRGFSAGGATGFFLFAALYASVFLLSQVLQTGLGLAPAAAGLRLVPWTATLLVVAPIGGALADRFGDRPPWSSAWRWMRSVWRGSRWSPGRTSRTGRWSRR